MAGIDMQTMHGCLSFISILDLIQWADNSKRSGTLVLSCNELQKKFYFQDGKIILVDSGLNNELFDDFLMLESDLSIQDLQEKKSIADKLGLPFIGYLVSENIISKEVMNKTIRHISLSAVIDVLKWQSGKFEFNSDIPNSVMHGPITINSSMLLMESVNKFDESRKGSTTDINLIVNKLRNDIMTGNIDLPAVPDIIQQIQKKIEDPTASIEKIVDCITDQIIAAKILRICNSPYYKTTTKISTLKEAVVLIGLKSLVSIVAVHALSSFSPKNTGEVRTVLSHSLVCAMIARQIARDLSSDYELAFICGLLHDIGKTVMLDMLDEYMLPTKLRAKVVEENHTEIGQLLAKKWNFGEDILECIQYHHSPDKATTNRSMVELVYLANTMAHTSDQPGTNGEIFLSMAQCNRYSESNFKNNEIQQESVKKQIGQVKNMYKDAWDFLG
jgi:putative nucleotidyltransferase with HDIG domain